MTRTMTKGEWEAKREAENQEICARLSVNGKMARGRKTSGNVRVFLWFNPSDESVPGFVEILRCWSSITVEWGTTRMLEASDLAHLQVCLNDIASLARIHLPEQTKPQSLSEETIRKAISRGQITPDDPAISNNVALLPWKTDTVHGDALYKSEILCVESLSVAERFFRVSQIDDVAKCVNEMQHRLTAAGKKADEVWARDLAEEDRRLGIVSREW